MLSEAVTVPVARGAFMRAMMMWPSASRSPQGLLLTRSLRVKPLLASGVGPLSESEWAKGTPIFW